jgi:transcriptional antiterminator NusG
VTAAETEETETPAGPILEVEGMDWYVVNTFSGFENKAKLSLLERIDSLGLEDDFGEILVPEEQVVERTKTGKTRQRSKRFYPGYILVQMHLDNRTWHVVNNIPKISGFVGGSNRRPPKVPLHEVKRILGLMQDGAAEVKPKLEFEKGEPVLITDGHFANFNGVVDEVRPEQGKLRVLISIFGRATPVELEFTQVQKN